MHLQDRTHPKKGKIYINFKHTDMEWMKLYGQAKWKSTTLIPSIVLLLFMFSGITGYSQVSRLNRSERDSLRAIPYPYKLPIYGQRVRNKGIDFPLPLGFMVNYIHQQTEVYIENPKIALGGSDLVSVDFLEFEPVVNHTNLVNFRADAWIFPFLNVYGIYATSKTDSYVSMRFPISFDIQRNPTADTFGFGGVMGYGIGDYFVVANLNYSWSNVDVLDDLVEGRVISARLVKNFELNGDNQNINVSVGFQNQKVTRDSSGELSIGEIFEFFDQENLDNLKDQIASSAQNWYDELSLPQKVVVDQLVDILEDKVNGVDVDDIPLRYNFDKVPLGNWSFQLGVQYNHNKHWWFRVEAGIGKGRKQLMTSVNYRFGL